MRAVALRFRRFGSPRVHEMLIRGGIRVNHKRTERIYAEERLQLPRRKRRRRRGTPAWTRSVEATRPNEVWCYDFMFKKTEYGERMKFLTMEDEFTKESLDIAVGRRMTSDDVRRSLERLIAERGAPAFTRSDNGPEFIACGLHRFLTAKGVVPVHIDPGSPWQNPFAESFNGRFRDECLNQEMIFSRAEAQYISDRYRRHFNEERPHSSLGYKTPAEFAATWAG